MRSTGLWVALGFAAIYLIWGSTYLGIAVTVETIPPVFMVAVRGLLAGAVLYAWARARGAAPIRFAEIRETVPTAALLFGGGYVLVGWAEQYVPSGPAALLNSTTPAFVVLLEWMSGRRGTPGLRVMSALILGVAGIALLVMSGNGSGDAALNLPAACALLAASAAWAFGTVRAGNHATKDPLRAAALQLLTGAALLLPISAVLGDLSEVWKGTVSAKSLLALAYLTVFGSLIGYSAYVWLLHHVPAARVASHAYVNPLIAVLLGAALAHEPVSGATILAAVSIVVAVLLIVTDRATPKRKPLRGRVLSPNLSEPAAMDPT